MLYFVHFFICTQINSNEVNEMLLIVSYCWLPFTAVNEEQCRFESTYEGLHQILTLALLLEQFVSHA